MKFKRINIIFILGITLLTVTFQKVGAIEHSPIYLGRMYIGNVYAVKNNDGKLGIEIHKKAETFLKQSFPVQIQVYFNEFEIKNVYIGYDSIDNNYQCFTGYSSFKVNENTFFNIVDEWRITANFMDLSRSVIVKGNSEGGFYSEFSVEACSWYDFPDIDYFIPGALYGGPEFLSERAVAGKQVFNTGIIELAEDRLAAPMFGMYFRDGTSVGLINTGPDGQTTVEESKDIANATIIDGRLKFGTFCFHDVMDGGVTIGYRYPATAMVRKRTRSNVTSEAVNITELRRRYHPIKDGYEQRYNLSLRIGQDERYMDFVTQNWRAAWNFLNPSINYHDIDIVKKSLFDMLSGQVVIYENRTAIPFILNSITGEPDLDRYPESTNAILGFCGRSMEAAYYFLIESERNPESYRGKLLQKQATGIINSFLKIEMAPPEAEGFGIYDGALKNTRPLEDVMYLRSFTDDMKSLLAAYNMEKEAGRIHPEWLAWCKKFADWLLPQQTPEGGFPRTWYFLDTETGKKGEIANNSPTSSYNVVPFLVKLGDITGHPVYLESAIKAAEFCWNEYHSKNNFIGGTIDNPNIVDKEAGTLSLEAYLILYETTGEEKWLKRAERSANFAETWMYIWDIPMPVDKENTEIHWKENVSTVGLQGINSTNPGGGDMYMTYEVDEYARLYKYTNDEHYLDVARILLHNTKGLLALPGRTYGMVGPGWQQEHWGIASPQRGYGGHRDWLPWVSTSHLNGILMLEQFDKVLYRQLTEQPAGNKTHQTESKEDSIFLSFRVEKDVSPSADPDSEFWRNIEGIEINTHIRNGMAPEQFHSEVRSRWSDKYLYLLFTAPYEILDLRSMPDTTKDTWRLWENDVFEAYLGTDFNNINLYKEFQISPQGEFLDLAIDASSEKPGYGDERLWNSGMKTKARIDHKSNTWYGEMVIPLSALGLKNEPVNNQYIRCNIYRFLRTKDGQRLYLGWKTIQDGFTHTPEKFGILKLVSN